MNLLIIGGLHGDETLGIEIVRLLKEKPIQNVTTIFGNPSAIATNTRYCDKDLNRVFPGKENGCIEEVRAKQIVDFAKNFDLILDFHNTTAIDNDNSFVHSEAKDFLFNVSAFLGLNKVVIADYSCINESLSNCISIEVSYASELCSASYWYKKILELSTANILKAKVQKYKIIGKLEQKPSKELTNWQVLDSEMLQELSLKGEIYPIFIGEKAYGTQYCTLVSLL